MKWGIEMILRLASIFFCFFILISAKAASSGEEAPPLEIRQFDIPTIEQLGREMYNQDRRAWIATDVLVANHIDAKRENIHGWISEPLLDPRRVRFIRQTSNTTEAAFDVVFFNDMPQLQTPTDRTLSPDELAQFNARRLGAENIEKMCSDTYNTIALKDPDSDGWLVWVMPATKKSGIVMMGVHYRLTISANGKTVLRRDALSHDCMQLSSKSENEKTLSGLITTHIVSLTPIETHVFTSLGLPMPLYVGTMDGKAWKVEKGNITNIEQDSAGVDGFSARAFAGMNEQCRFIARKLDETEQKYYNVGDPKVIDATEHVEKFVPEVPRGYKADSMICVRQDIVPSPNDYKVVIAGLPLYIADKGVGHVDRVGTLEISGGQFRFRLVDGAPLTEELKARVGGRLDVFQDAIQTGK